VIGLVVVVFVVIGVASSSDNPQTSQELFTQGPPVEYENPNSSAGTITQPLEVVEPRVVDVDALAVHARGAFDAPVVGSLRNGDSVLVVVTDSIQEVLPPRAHVAQLPATLLREDGTTTHINAGSLVVVLSEADGPPLVSMVDAGGETIGRLSPPDALGSEPDSVVTWVRVRLGEMNGFVISTFLKAIQN
jgi:hypothetical protein